MMAKLGPLARSDVCAGLRGVERLITHLYWLVSDAAILVAAEDAVEVVGVVGDLSTMGAVVVVVAGTAVVLLVWLLN